MPRGPIITVALVLVLSCVFAAPAAAQRFGGDDDDFDSGSEKAPEKKKKGAIPTRPRISLVAKLPEAYRDKDKNGDGQIGLYEWSRKDIATFRKLDRNGDGFLTAAELLSGPGKSGSGASVTSVASTSKPGDTTTSSSGASTSTTTASSTSASTTPAPSSSSASTAAASGAETAFRLLDKDGNSSVSSEEWQRSLLTRTRFEKNGITPTLPMSKEEFLKFYQQLK